MLYRGILERTPVGPIEIVAEDNYIIKVDFRKAEKAGEIDKFLTRYCGAGYAITPGLPPVMSKCMIQLDEYFYNGRQHFDLPVKLYGTPFYQRVWAQLTQIPYGEVITYGALAGLADSPKGFRAVGQANHHNPISIIVPCHRVIGSNNKLTGYGGGVEIKKILLALENKELADSLR